MIEAQQPFLKVAPLVLYSLPATHPVSNKCWEFCTLNPPSNSVRKRLALFPVYREADVQRVVNPWLKGKWLVKWQRWDSYVDILAPESTFPTPVLLCLALQAGPTLQRRKGPTFSHTLWVLS